MPQALNTSRHSAANFFLLKQFIPRNTLASFTNVNHLRVLGSPNPVQSFGRGDCSGAAKQRCFTPTSRQMGAQNLNKIIKILSGTLILALSGTPSFWVRVCALSSVFWNLHVFEKCCGKSKFSRIVVVSGLWVPLKASPGGSNYARCPLFFEGEEEEQEGEGRKRPTHLINPNTRSPAHWRPVTGKGGRVKCDLAQIPNTSIVCIRIGCIHLNTSHPSENWRFIRIPNTYERVPNIHLNT